MTDFARAYSEVKSLPDEALQRELQNPTGAIPGFLILGEMNERRSLRAGSQPENKMSLAQEYMGKGYANGGQVELTTLLNPFVAYLEGLTNYHKLDSDPMIQDGNLPNPPTLGEPGPPVGLESLVPLQPGVPKQPKRLPYAGGGLVDWREAIASIESAGSGGYSAIGPTHPKLGRALGRYQVMEANVGPWSKKYLGRKVSAKEFLANPDIQDAVFNGEFGSYVKRFGSPEAAAQAWFGGPGAVGKTGRKDSLGTSVGQYSRKFSNAVGRGGQGGVPLPTPRPGPTHVPMPTARPGTPGYPFPVPEATAAAPTFIKPGMLPVQNAMAPSAGTAAQMAQIAAGQKIIPAMMAAPKPVPMMMAASPSFVPMGAAAPMAMANPVAGLVSLISAAAAPKVAPPPPMAAPPMKPSAPVSPLLMTQLTSQTPNAYRSRRRRYG